MSLKEEKGKKGKRIRSDVLLLRNGKPAQNLKNIKNGNRDEKRENQKYCSGSFRINGNSPFI